MPKITAFLHTYNDALRIGRALESLRAFDEILVIDHASTDDSIKIARAHGATVKEGVPGVNQGVYVIDAHHDWIFCLQPNESVSESLEAALFEWKQRRDEPADHAEKDSQAGDNPTYSVSVREESDGGWKTLGAETRLVNRKQINWNDAIPPNNPDSLPLEGELLRFSKP
jgi:glycosyltransferase involved in cell wall biosynthesis